MNLTILGSSAMFATVERAASGYLLELGDSSIWLDAGGGTWRNLLQYVDYRAVDGVILSHRHPDHTIDVFQAFHARRYGGPEPLDPIPLWAPQETIDCLVAFTDNLKETFDMSPVGDGDTIDAAGATISFVKMAHPPYTVGLRVERDGQTLAYSADTGADADFDALARDADLFVCEATFQDSDEPWEGHLRASQAGAIAARAGAKRLVLTHLPAERDLNTSMIEAQHDSGDVVVELAVDGRRYEGLQ